MSRVKIRQSASKLELALLSQIQLAGLPMPEREKMLIAGRRFRTDFSWPDQKLAVETEGGVWGQGRHQRPHGFNEDCVKYNTLTLMGWRVLRVTETHVRSGEALRWIEEALHE